MCSVVKCANCNVVINEVLAFVHNKISVMDDESISRICASAFSESEIVTAKKLLFESLPTTKRKILRRKAGKNARDIDDIIRLIRDTDPEEIPVFVARDLEKLPPVLFDHVDVTRLLKDIVKLRQDLDMIKEEYATGRQLDQLRTEVQHLSSGWCNVNLRRGAYVARLGSYECDSGPKGLPLDCNVGNSECYQQQTTLQSTPKESIHNSFEHRTLEGSPETSPQYKQCDPTVELRDSAAMTHAAGQRFKPVVSPSPAATSGGGPPHNVPLPRVLSPTACNAPLSPTLKSAMGLTVDKNGSHPTAPKQKSMAEIVREGEWNSQARSDQWVLVQKKRLRNRFVGKRGKASPEPGSNFMAAETKIPMYIYNVAKGVSICDIRTYIMKKSNVDVKIEKVSMKLAKDYESYKIFVPECSLNVFLSDDFWPKGVAYRRFINFIRRGKDNIRVTGKNTGNTKL